MPSFDIVSEIDHHELNNAVQQCHKEIRTRFDLAKTEANIEYSTNVTLYAENDFQLKQIMDILQHKLTKRSIDPKALHPGKIQTDHKNVKQILEPIKGIEQPLAKQINQSIKQSKLKVQSQIQDKKIRVTAKKRDDLQSIMNILKEMDLSQPLQYTNFKD